jgi:CRISPR system Cascade subunit CasA
MSVQFNLLDERLIRYRTVSGNAIEATLPELFVALGEDQVRDFPSLRPHQRHPWHAFLVQLAAIALHASGQDALPDSADAWRRALLNLTPDDTDGAAFSLVSPDDRCAFLQAPCSSGETRAWKKRIVTPDALDMLITSRNHDLKAARMICADPQDWIYALVSLQTQEGFLGAGNYGVSRMNGGFASRPAVGVVPVGNVGKRWARDSLLLHAQRAQIAEGYQLKQKGGLALVWLRAWDGASSLSFNELDPLYIEICRRVRLLADGGKLFALATSSKAARIAAKERNGVTGDAWTPVNIAQAKALSITAKGFDYKLASTLAFPLKNKNEYRPTIASTLLEEDGEKGIVLLAQGITRGQGKTEGYHERRIPISPRMAARMRERDTDELAAAAGQRIDAIGHLRKALWIALCGLLGNGDPDVSDDTKKKAGEFACAFEQKEDARFFDDLVIEIEAHSQEAARDAWLAEVFDRAKTVLEAAFVAGPRSAERRYRARAAALSRFANAIRSEKSGLSHMERVLKERSEARKAARQSNASEEVET